MTLICWNCGGPHHLKDCAKPLNQPKVDEARQKFKASQRAKGKPKHKFGTDGKPLVLNKNGFYVLDQRRWKAYLAATSTDPGPRTGDSAPTSVVPQGNLALAPTATSRVAFQADAIRSALRESQLSHS